MDRTPGQCTRRLAAAVATTLGLAGVPVLLAPTHFLERVLGCT